MEKSGQQSPSFLTRSSRTGVQRPSFYYFFKKRFRFYLKLSPLTNPTGLVTVCNCFLWLVAWNRKMANFTQWVNFVLKSAFFLTKATLNPGEVRNRWLPACDTSPSARKHLDLTPYQTTASTWYAHLIRLMYTVVQTVEHGTSRNTILSFVGWKKAAWFHFSKSTAK